MQLVYPFTNDECGGMGVRGVEEDYSDYITEKKPGGEWDWEEGGGVPGVLSGNLNKVVQHNQKITHLLTMIDRGLTFQS